MASSSAGRVRGAAVAVATARAAVAVTGRGDAARLAGGSASPLPPLSAADQAADMRGEGGEAAAGRWKEPVRLIRSAAAARSSRTRAAAAAAVARELSASTLSRSCDSSATTPGSAVPAASDSRSSSSATADRDGTTRLLRADGERAICTCVLRVAAAGASSTSVSRGLYAASYASCTSGANPVTVSRNLPTLRARGNATGGLPAPLPSTTLARALATGELTPSRPVPAPATRMDSGRPNDVGLPMPAAMLPRLATRRSAEPASGVTTTRP